MQCSQVCISLPVIRVPGELGPAVPLLYNGLTVTGFFNSRERACWPYFREDTNN